MWPVLWLLLALAAVPAWAELHEFVIPEQISEPVIGVESGTMEVYIEGQLAGRVGALPPAFRDSPRGYSTFAVPGQLAQPGRTITVEVRTWNPPGSRYRPMRLTPVAVQLHPKGETEIYERVAWAEFRGYAWSAGLSAAVLLLIAIAGRSQQRGRLLTLALAAWSAFVAYELLLMAGFLFPWSRGSYLATGVLVGFMAIAPVDMIAAIVERRPPWWMRFGQAFFLLAQLALVSANLFYEEPAWLPIAGAAFLVAGFVPAVLAAGLLMQSKGLRGRALVLPLLLTVSLAGSGLTRLAGAQGRAVRISAGGVVVPANTLGFSLFGLALAGVTLAHFRRSGQVASQLQGQLAAARSMQHMLLTGNSSVLAGYRIDTAYQPAQEVGGDFFRTLPAPGGATLLVVGDVSGKGLRAAMMVSVLVGALLNRRSSEPAEVLDELNRAITGQLHNGFVTCCAALFAASGEVAIASAGHMAPYCRGVEIEVPAGLPLGIVEGVRYETARLQLGPGERLTFLSDGVLEAANIHGELFGFERARAVCGTAASEIAGAAMAWGQNDDITVVAVQRAA